MYLFTTHWGNHKVSPVCFSASCEPTHSDWLPLSREAPMIMISHVEILNDHYQEENHIILSVFRPFPYYKRMILIIMNLKGSKDSSLL